MPGINNILSYSFGRIAQLFDYKQLAPPPSHTHLISGSIYLALVAITLGVSRIEAQVTIGGEETAAGSLLSLNSTMRGGLLLSNVKLEDLYEIPTSFPGMSDIYASGGPILANAKKDFTGSVVYNINGLIGRGKGIYSWDGEKWYYIGGGLGVTTGNVAFLDNTNTNNPVTYWLEFMTYNLGATPMSIDEQTAYPRITTYNTSYIGDKTAATPFKTIFGDMYQWGRRTDGHEKVWSALSPNVPVPLANYTNAGEEFSGVLTSAPDWLEGYGNNKKGRWGGQKSDDYANNHPTSKGINDPCPSGLRVPSNDEWQGITQGLNNSVGFPDVDALISFNGINRWVWHDGSATTTVSGWLVFPPKQLGTTPSADNNDYESSPTLFLPAAGYRNSYTGVNYQDGRLSLAGTEGWYWSSTVKEKSEERSYMVNIYNQNDNIVFQYTHRYSRALGHSVRCVAEH